MTLDAPTNGTLGTDTVHTLTITDNDDAPTVTVTSTSQFTLNTPSGLTVTAPYTLTGTATGTDYSVTASPALIAPGDTTATVTFTITDDTLDENSETAILTLDAPTNGTLGTDTVHTLTITDNDDAPTVQWTAASQSGAESVGTLTITAEINAVSGLTVTIPYTVTGTATGSGTDYSITASPITITAGSTTTTVTITVVEDVLDEISETVVTTIGVPTNATVGATNIHTATITDNDAAPSVYWTESSQSVTEDDTVITLTAELDAVSGLTVTIPYTMTGSATGGGSDYSITTSPVTITAGQTATDITITIIEDVIVEPDETVIVTMGTPTNAGPGVTTVHTVTIVRDDFAKTYSPIATTVGNPTGAVVSDTVNFTSPTDGEEISEGTIKTIKWSSSGFFSFVNLYYSTDSSQTFNLIERNLVNTGSYTWTIPSEVGATVIIKIEGTDLATVLATDTATFSIIDGVFVEEPTETTTEEETLTEEETQEQINIIGIALETVLGDRWVQDADRRGVADIFADFPETVVVGSLIKLFDDGNPETQFDSAVYYIGADLRRHPFPNEAVYKTWFTNFFGIREVDETTMAAILVGPMVTYRPGSSLVKFPSVPKVYFVDSTGALRWITSEELAISLYGNSWASGVNDISEAFWSSYIFGSDLISMNDENWAMGIARH
ncbi:MAG: Calx-beta domain-containing protein [Candidatus Uhrbacteria bacterium GW2011_GWF2_44_350]|uniref:Calx-beta domain-containing protein n=2 Tax=Candidatus Uhriibacteriota TaxID=1752732 RepID=A0A0G1JHH3_9BACT|nr:MAG: Calx-beta domain-containing protein [Candidatus Uhrbacteria bacterium GW2011_GWF2_44_350]